MANGGAASTVAGAAGFGAFGPAALLAFGPAFLSKLFGGDPQKKYRKQVAQLFSPQNIAKLTNQFYRQQVSSPGFSQAQGAIAAGANQTGQNLAQALASRGLGTTGAGAILGSAIPSIVGSQQAGLRTTAQGAAQSQAMQAIQAQLDALRGTQGPSQTQQQFGVGLDAFGQFLAKKYPQLFSGMG